MKVKTEDKVKSESPDVAEVKIELETLNARKKYLEMFILFKSSVAPLSTYQSARHAVYSVQKKTIKNFIFENLAELTRKVKIEIDQQIKATTPKFIMQKCENDMNRVHMMLGTLDIFQAIMAKIQNHPELITFNGEFGKTTKENDSPFTFIGLPYSTLEAIFAFYGFGSFLFIKKGV